MPKQNNSYWSKRQLSKMEHIHSLSDKDLARLLKAKDESLKFLEEQIDKIFNTYTKNNKLSKEEALKLLSTKETKEYLDTLRQRYSKTNDPTLLKIINAPAYNFRISRLEALKKEVELEYQLMTRIEQERQIEAFEKAYKESYKIKDFDLAKMSGVKPATVGISKDNIISAIKHKWNGKDFVERVGINNKVVASTVTNQIDMGIQAGISVKEMVNNLREATHLSKINATRIMRTEVTFATNQAEHDIRVELDIEKYRFIATLDLKTSKICQEHDNKEFLVKDMKVGENYPPMHPHCRSTTIDVFEDDDMQGYRAAKDKNGKRILVPKTMTYEEYKKKHFGETPGIKVDDVKDVPKAIKKAKTP